MGFLTGTEDAAELEDVAEGLLFPDKPDAAAEWSGQCLLPG